MTEKERGRFARDIGYEAACGVTQKLMRQSTYQDGTVDVGVYFAALGFAANTLMAQLNADTMLNTYQQTARLEKSALAGLEHKFAKSWNRSDGHE